MKIAKIVLACLLSANMSVSEPEVDCAAKMSDFSSTQTINYKADDIKPIVQKTEIPEEHENAYLIWKRLEDEGYSKHAIAGILGNIMTEVGGQTLNIDPNLYGADGWFYGICQWNANTYSEVHGTELEYQIGFLINTIKHEFDAFGEMFDCSFEDFKNIEDEQLAARRFAQVYERCDSDTYEIRQQNASVAYDYFISLV